MNSESAIARPLAVMSKERKARARKRVGNELRLPGTRTRKEGDLGHSCLLFSEAGARIFIRLADAIRNKYATNE